MKLEDILEELNKYGADALHEKAKFSEINPKDISTLNLENGLYVCQPKWDGWFLAMVVLRGKEYRFTRSRLISETKSNMPQGLYKGEWIANTNWSYSFNKGHWHDWLVLFDYETEKNNPDNYLERLQRLEELEVSEDSEDQKICLIDSFWGKDPKTSFEKAIKGGFEGIVISTADAKIKAKKHVSCDFVVMGFKNSESGTYKGWGIRHIVYGDGKKVIGHTSGMPDSWKREFFLHPEKYLGTWIEVSGKEIFPSGAVRHPKFERIREDKPRVKLEKIFNE